MKQKTHTLIVSLRQVRKAKQMRQYELASRIGVDTTLVSRWENGLRSPSWFSLVCWADALGVQITISEKNDAA